MGGWGGLIMRGVGKEILKGALLGKRYEFLGGFFGWCHCIDGGHQRGKRSAHRLMPAIDVLAVKLVA